jgi:prophage tail gpP-like protein
MNLKIDHRIGVIDVEFFNGFKLDLSFDSVGSSFSTAFYLDPFNREQVEAACVSHYHEAIFQHEGETLLTGYILSQSFKRNANKQLTVIGGYSKPGVFEDCHIPPDLFPLQSDGLTILEIATKIANRFDIEIVVNPSVSAKMNRVISVSTSALGQTIKSYLTELCKQRDIVVTHDELGRLVFTQANTNTEPIFHVEKGILGRDISLVFSGQPMHSDITVMKQASVDTENASQATVENPYVRIVYRPRVIKQTSGDDNSAADAARQALAAELRNVTLTIVTDRWTVNGKVIRPNNIISVKSPENYIYKKTNFFIQNVSLQGDAKNQTAILTCVVPEVYNGQVPKNIFVDAHENLPRF